MFQYSSPLQGQAIMIDNHFSFVLGSSDSTMITEAGTYIESNDTIYNKVLYSSNPKLIGYEFKWSVESFKGDTIIYVVYNNKGEITSRGKAIKVN